MLYIKTDLVEVAVDEKSGGDIVSLKYLPNSTEFAHRDGLQTWIKSGDRTDPASGVLSNFYGGITSPEFGVIDQTDTIIILQTIIQDLKIIKSIEITQKVLVVSITLENISKTIEEIPLQIESFCNLAGAKSEERDNTVIFLANGNELSSNPIYLEKYAQRYALPFEHDGESIVVANTQKKSYMEISGSENAECLALVIHANRLCWGINAPKQTLKSAESTSSSLSFSIHPGKISERFSIPDKKSNTRKKSSTCNFDSLLAGQPVFEERWSHLCLQYDKTEPDDVKKVIAELLAPMKYSGVVLELDRGVRLKSHPEIAADFALDIDTVKDIADFAKSHGLKVGVEFNTPGHQNETGIPEAYPELMEPKPANIPGHVLCVSNPKTRSLIKDIIFELQETIEPEMLMLGGDEVQFEGYKGTPFGHCSLCEKQMPLELFSDYIKWLLSLVKTGIRPSIAGDMFLQSKQFGDVVSGNGSEGDMWKAISSVSKNTIMLDWHYYPADEYHSLDYFRDLGYDVWPLTAFTFDGLRNFLLYAEKIGIKKAMHTTWSVPNQEKLFIETMFWAGCYHWLGKAADELPMREIAVPFCNNFW